MNAQRGITRLRLRPNARIVPLEKYQLLSRALVTIVLQVNTKRATRAAVVRAAKRLAIPTVVMTAQRVLTLLRAKQCVVIVPPACILVLQRESVQVAQQVRTR